MSMFASENKCIERRSKRRPQFIKEKKRIRGTRKTEKYAAPNLWFLYKIKHIHAISTHTKHIPTNTHIQMHTKHTHIHTAM